MHFELGRSAATPGTAAAVRRVLAEGTRWRVLVEVWPERHGWTGRLIFRPDSTDGVQRERFGPPQLRGRTREAVIASAHEVDERRLVEMLHSLA